MKKEEFLAMSLTYGLIISQNGYQYQLTSQVYKLNNRGIWNVKPICRPLSDLTKPIEHNGEKFVPIDNIEGLFIEGTEDLINQSIEAIEYFIENNFFSRMEYLPFILIQKLIEWKFDLFGGIDSGDAIDVNTLTENPYK